MPLIKKCKICGEEFRTKPFFVKNGGGVYCSRDCHYKGIRTGKEVQCFVCGKDTYKSLQSLKRSKSKKFFCNKSCQTKWRNTEFVGDRHANWKEGKHSYRSVLVRNKIPKVCKLCNSKDERVLATHHIDRNRKNNVLDNLVWLCHNCHFLVHNHQAGDAMGLLR